MSWAFLGISLVGLALTLNTFRPIGGVLRIPAFFASWLVNELPLHTLVGQAAVTVAFARAGALGAWPGRVGLLVMALSSGGVIVLWRRGHRAGHTMRSVLGPHGGNEPWPRVPGHKLWLPFAPGRSGVRRIKNLVFTGEEKKKLELDVFLPQKAGERRPAILQIHGGGWVIGDKREQGLPLLHHLATHGWVGFNANYRLSPRATFPDHLIDVKRAIAWVREHAAEYGVDPGFVCITGGS
ncbi:MAG TPA: alpha/beta hydrolase, partial [Polyangiaceae bacterium]